MIETRIPFKQIDEFVKQRNIFQSFKTAEKRMQTFNQEFDQLKDNFRMMELDFKRIEKLFTGVTRDHIVEVMELTDYKAGVSNTMGQMQSQIDDLRDSLKEEISNREKLQKETNLLIEKIDQ